MGQTEIYLDNNATTRALPEVIEVVTEYMGNAFGNASSAHFKGNNCRRAVEQSRDWITEFIGADPQHVIFTSCGTEANNLVLNRFLMESGQHSKIITSVTEHSSILKMCTALERHGCEIVYLPVDSKGLVSSDQLKQELEKASASLVSIQWVNSETGVVQPVEQLVRICHQHGVLFHSDAAQAIGKLRLSVSDIPVDYLTFTGHKFHAPQGVGAVYARKDSALQPLLHGGDQEMGYRPGTENLPGIAGMGKAIQIRAQTFEQATNHMRTLRNTFEELLHSHVDGILINGNGAERVCNTSNIQFRGIDGQALVAQLSNRNIYCSQSSACNNRRPEPSHVLRAMGLTEDEAYASVRFSFSILNTMDDVHRSVEAITDIHRKLSLI